MKGISTEFYGRTSEAAVLPDEQTVVEISLHMQVSLMQLRDFAKLVELAGGQPLAGDHPGELLHLFAAFCDDEQNRRAIAALFLSWRRRVSTPNS